MTEEVLKKIFAGQLEGFRWLTFIELGDSVPQVIRIRAKNLTQLLDTHEYHKKDQELKLPRLRKK